MAKRKLNGPNEPEQDVVKIERFRTQLRVTLTAPEIAERADRAAHLLSERDEKEAASKAYQKHAKGQIEEVEAELRRVSNEVRDRATYAEVQCERRLDYRRGIVSEVRSDTGEVLNERPLTDFERQRSLDLEGADAPEDADDFDDDDLDLPEPEQPKRKNQKRAAVDRAPAE